MSLFVKAEKLITDLYEFSGLLSKAISGTDIKIKDDDKIKKWGSEDPKIKHSYGRNLEYRKVKFWVGVSISRTSKIVNFVVQFKTGTIKLSQKRTVNKKMPDESFDLFKKNKKIQIIQDFLLNTGLYPINCTSLSNVS